MQESVSRNFLDPEPICQPTFDLGIFSAPVFCRAPFPRSFGCFRIVSASFPRPEIGVGAPFPRSHRNDEQAFFTAPKTGGGTKFDVGHFSRAHVLPWALLFRARSACSDSQRAFPAPVNRCRRTFSALILTLLAWSRLSTWPYTSSGRAHLARPAGGRAPPGGVGGGRGELFVPHMTLRRPL